MPYLRRYCSNGHDDISRSLSRDTNHTSERASVRSLLKASRSVSFHGPSMPCPRFSTFPCSCSSPASLFSFATLISRSSSAYYRGSACARLSTGASHVCRSFVTTVHITRHSHCQRGTLLLGHYIWSIGFFGGSISRFTPVLVPYTTIESW